MEQRRISNSSSPRRARQDKCSPENHPINSAGDSGRTKVEQQREDHEENGRYAYGTNIWAAQVKQKQPTETDEENRDHRKDTRQNPEQLIRNAFLKSVDEENPCSLNQLVKIVESHGTMLNEVQWRGIVNRFIIGSAVKKGGVYIDSAVQLCVRLIERNAFQAAVYDALMENLGEIMNPSGRYNYHKGQNLCSLMGKLLVARWPRMYNSSAKECNQIIFAVLSAVYGWLGILEEDEAGVFGFYMNTLGILYEAGVIMEAGVCFGHHARQLSSSETKRLEEDTVLVPDFKQRKLEVEAMKNWDKFYNRNQTNFFKDRHWTTEEFSELCPDVDFQVLYFLDTIVHSR